MPYPDLVWTLLASVGGLLLIEQTWSHLRARGKWGVVLIYAGFLFQVYWEILHQTASSNLVWNTTSQLQVAFVTFMVILSVILGIVIERKSRKRNSHI